MRNSTGFLLVLALASFPGAAVAGGKYNIDPSHSNLQFAVKHMVISDVKGTFQDFSGTVVYDEEEIGNSSVRITIKTESLDTGNDDRDNHLRGPDFFDAGQYPEITFLSKAIRKSANGFVAAGTLTMHGVSKEIELPFEILGKVTDPWGNTRIGIQSKYSLNRQDFGVSWSKTLDAGGLVVSNEVRIELNVEAILVKPKKTED